MCGWSRSGSPGQASRLLRQTDDVPTFEKGGTGSMGLSASGIAAAGALGASAMIGVGLRLIVQPAGGEPGYHLTLDPPDLVGGGLTVGLGVAALYATFRALRFRDFL